MYKVELVFPLVVSILPYTVFGLSGRRTPLYYVKHNVFHSTLLYSLFKHNKSKLNPTAASWTPTQMKPRAIGQKPISKPAVNMAPNFGKPVGRKTPPNVQKIEAGDGIYIQTKHKQTTLRSSRDQQNFPSIPTHANNTKNVNEGIPNINPIVAQTIFQRNQSKFLHI